VQLLASSYQLVALKLEIYGLILLSVPGLKGETGGTRHLAPGSKFLDMMQASHPSCKKREMDGAPAWIAGSRVGRQGGLDGALRFGCYGPRKQSG
jgi:hypothetical protein